MSNPSLDLIENFTKKQYVNQGKLVYHIQISSVYPRYLGCVLLEKVRIAFNLNRYLQSDASLFTHVESLFSSLNSELNLIGSNYSHKNRESNLF